MESAAIHNTHQTNQFSPVRKIWISTQFAEQVEFTFTVLKKEAD